MDERWLDVTGSRICGSGMEIAQKIRRAVREELGLTVSIGVSFIKPPPAKAGGVDTRLKVALRLKPAKCLSLKDS